MALATDLGRKLLGAGPRPMEDNRLQIQLVGAGGFCGFSVPSGMVLFCSLGKVAGRSLLLSSPAAEVARGGGPRG